MKPQLSIVEGNLFDATEPFLLHQVNCRGVMGAGIARELLERYPAATEGYFEECGRLTPEELLGTFITGKLTQPDGRTQTILHCCAQLHHGRDRRYTDYEALYTSLAGAERYVREVGERLKHVIKTPPSIAAPYMMGCGLAGGSWRIVEAIFYDVFIDSPVPLTFYRFNPKQQ